MCKIKHKANWNMHNICKVWLLEKDNYLCCQHGNIKHMKKSTIFWNFLLNIEWNHLAPLVYYIQGIYIMIKWWYNYELMINSFKI